MRKSLENEKLLSQVQKEDEPNNKPLLPQLLAAVAAGTFFLSTGFSMGFSAVLVPQLLDEQNCTDCTGIVRVTRSDTAWIVSSMRLLSPLCAPMGGLVMDLFGRLNLLKLAIVPAVTGWIVLGAATSRNMLILGRILTGISLAWSGAAITYISEISNPSMRGCLLAVAHVFGSLGTLIILVEGSIMHWKQIAWSCSVAVTLPVLWLVLLHESPSWLVFKNRIISAYASLEWFNRIPPGTEDKGQLETLNNEIQLLVEKNLKQGIQTNSRKTKIQQYLNMFVEPTAYKPLLIMLGLFFFQQASGAYIVNMYAVTFIQNVGTTIDPYRASVGLGVIKVMMSIAHIWITKAYNRRTLLFFSTIGMSVSIGLSGVYTKWILQGTTTHQWIPIAFLMIYVLSSMVGLTTLPYMIVGEVFPLAIRGVAQNLVFTITSFIMFAATQSYYTLNDYFGPSGLQYLFSAVSLIGFFYCYAFVPETHNKTLAEIEEQFAGRNSYVKINGCTEYNTEEIHGSSSKTYCLI